MGRGPALTPPLICELQLLHSERYRLSGMLIHRQNSYAPRGRQCTGRLKAESSGTGQQSKNPPTS
jgi:hypothetical protein